MAIYHLSVKAIQRSKGRSAVAAAAYRAGEKLYDSRTGLTHDYSKRTGVEYTSIIFPKGTQATMNREELWNAAENAEKRKDSTTAKEYEIALPAELENWERIQLAKSFALYLSKRHKCVVDIAVHSPGKNGDKRNYHAHLLCTTRIMTSEKTLGCKCDVELSDRDRAKKNLPGRKTELQEARSYWAERINSMYPKLAVDHKSLEKQGKLRQPTIHLGHAACAMERRGERSDRGELNRAIQKDNQLLAEAQNNLQAIPDEIAKLEQEYVFEERNRIIIERKKLRDQELAAYKSASECFTAAQKYEGAKGVRELEEAHDAAPWYKRVFYDKSKYLQVCNDFVKEQRQAGQEWLENAEKYAQQGWNIAKEYPYAMDYLDKRKLEEEAELRAKEAAEAKASEEAQTARKLAAEQSKEKYRLKVAKLENQAQNDKERGGFER